MVKSAALAKPLPCIRTYIQNLFTISDMHYFDLGIHFLMLTWINNIHAVILKKHFCRIVHNPHCTVSLTRPQTSRLASLMTPFLWKARAYSDPAANSSLASQNHRHHNHHHHYHHHHHHHHFWKRLACFCPAENCCCCCSGLCCCWFCCCLPWICCFTTVVLLVDVLGSLPLMVLLLILIVLLFVVLLTLLAFLGPG